VNPPGTALLWELIARTATVSASATSIAMAIGIPAGTALGLLRFRGQRAAPWSTRGWRSPPWSSV
jgi:hypothetical protein